MKTILFFLFLVPVSCNHEGSEKKATAGDTCACKDGTTVSKDEVVCISDRRWKCVYDDDLKTYQLKETAETCDEEDPRCESAASPQQTSFRDSGLESIPVSTVQPFACTSFTINPVPKPVDQVKGMACWAAVTTMMYAYKRNRDLTIADVVKEIGEPFPILYETDAGLSAKEKRDLLTKTGLKGEAPASLTLDKWCTLLKTHGPLWVTTDESPLLRKMVIHGRVLYGMLGDGTPAGTTMLFINPDGGKTQTEPFSDFIPKYEGELRKLYERRLGQALPPDYELRVQVIHW